MKFAKVALFLLAFALVGAALQPSAQADSWNKQTVVTFSEPVEVPGLILPAGTYMFRLSNSMTDRKIVQIFTADGSRVLATIITINDYRLKPMEKTIMTFTERPADAPAALRAWFYPGDLFGSEFVYPKRRALELAATTKVVVPAVAVDTIDEDAIKSLPIVAITPEKQEVEVAAVIQTTPPADAVVVTPAPAEVAPVAVTPVAVTPVTVTEELPKTGSSLPLLALMGALSIGIALGLKLLLKHAV
jgi:LPXTG-motif cell wall-anchored protein